jgi:hypothetical protein
LAAVRSPSTLSGSNSSLRATGGVKPYTWSIATGSLPDGLTLNTSTGEISGTPTTRGLFYVTIRVRDADTSLSSVAKPFAMRVYGQPDLVVKAISGPSSALPGQQMTVSATVRNQGKEAAGTSRLALFLSADPAIMER